MDTKNSTRMLSVVAGYFLLALATVGLSFRGTLYWMLPVLPGEPYGLGDVMELSFFFLLLGTALLVLLSGVALLLFKELGLASRAVGMAVTVPLVYFLLHPLVPRLV